MGIALETTYRSTSAWGSAGARTAESHPAAAVLAVADTFSAGENQSTMIPLKDGGQVAVTVIMPKDIDPEQAPIVFAGGLHHKIAVYHPFLLELARREKRKIFAFSLPGVGESHLSDGNSVNHAIFYEALLKVLHFAVRPGESVVVAGHSMGTIPVRHLYFRPSDTKAHVEKFVMVAPVPAERERKAGYSMDPLFLQVAGASVLLGMGIRPAFPSKFFQNHPEAETKWLEEIISTERLPVNLFSMLEILFAVDEEPMLQALAEGDPRLIWVVASEDHLIPRSNPGSWRAKKNVIVVEDAKGGADHSFLAGKKSVQRWVPFLQQALHNTEDDRDSLNEASLMRGIRFPTGLHMEVKQNGQTAAGLQAEMETPLSSWFTGAGGARLMVGGFDRFRVPVHAYADVRLRRPDGHGTLGPGVQVESDLRKFGPEAIAYVQATYNLYDIVELSLRGGFNVQSRSQWKRRSQWNGVLSLTLPF